MFVLARVGFFREALAKDQQAAQTAVARENRNQAFWRKRANVSGFVGNCRRDLPGFPAVNQLVKQGQRGRNGIQLAVKKACAKADWKPGPGRCARHGVGAWERSGSFGDEVSGSIFEITGKGFGMQRSFYLKLEQACEFVAIAHRTCLFYQVLQDHARVVCAPEKRPVNPFRATLHHWRRYPHKHNAKHRAQGHADVGAFREEARNRVGEKGNGHRGHRKEENRVASLDEDVARATLEQ